MISSLCVLAFSPAASMCAPACAQIERPLEVLLSSYQTIDFEGTPSAVIVTGSAFTGRDAGWAVPAAIFPIPVGAERGIVGQLSADLSLDPQVLRIARNIGGYEQGPLVDVSLAGGHLAYFTNDASAGMSLEVDSAWLDDTLLARRGDTLAAIGATWRSFFTIDATTDGAAIVAGEVEDPTTQNLLDVVVRWPGMEILYVEGQSVPGLATPGGRLTTEVNTSPSGNHWTATIDSASGGAMLYDGAVHEFEGGELAISGMPIPSQFLIPGASVWGTFSDAIVNDAGDLAFVEALFSSQETHLTTIRKGQVAYFQFLMEPTSLLGIGQDGVLLRRELFSREAKVESTSLLPPGYLVDIDRDGSADLGWSRTANGLTTGGLSAGGTVVFDSFLISPTNVSTRAVFRAPDLRIDETLCAGVPHSGGIPGRLAASGDTAAASQDLVLHVYDIPEAAVGFMLMSKDPGFAPTPGGSQGNLCLGGSIGRLNSQVFNPFFSTVASVRIDTTQIPQPMSTVGITAGETWYAQAWIRDVVPGIGLTSNFTEAIQIAFD